MRFGELSSCAFGSYLEGCDIGDFSTVLVGSVVSGSVGNKSIIGANSVVIDDFGDCVLLLGSPAKVYRRLD